MVFVMHLEIYRDGIHQEERRDAPGMHQEETRYIGRRRDKSGERRDKSGGDAINQERDAINQEETR